MPSVTNGPLAHRPPRPPEADGVVDNASLPTSDASSVEQLVGATGRYNFLGSFCIGTHLHFYRWLTRCRVSKIVSICKIS